MKGFLAGGVWLLLAWSVHAQGDQADRFNALFIKRFNCHGGQDALECMSRVCTQLPDNLLVNRFRTKFCFDTHQKLMMELRDRFERKRKNVEPTLENIVDFFYEYSCGDTDPRDDLIDWIEEKISKVQNANWLERQIFKAAHINQKNIDKLRSALRDVCGFPEYRQEVIAHE